MSDEEEYEGDNEQPSTALARTDNAGQAAIERRGFSSDELAQQNETAAIAVAAAAKAAIESRYILALKRPRDWDNTLQRLLKECDRPGFAESAIYKKPVGSKKNEKTGEWEKAYVEGLSVRFAEAALRYMTNVYVDATSIYDDQHKQIVRVTVTDLESNATVAMDVMVPKTVERSKPKKNQRVIRERINSYGDKVFVVDATDDEVLNKTNALISKAMRNGVLRLLPGDIQDDCEARCRATQRKGDIQDPGAAKKKIFENFALIGVMPDQLKAFLGHAGEVLNPKELVELRAIYAALRDGETSWAAIMGEKSDGAAENGKAAATANTAKVDELVKQQEAKRAEREAAKAKSAEVAKGEKAAEKADKPEPKEAPKSEPKAETAKADAPKNESRERQPGED